MILDFLNHLGSVVLTMLPARYRKGKELRSPAIASAFLEGFVAIGLLIGRVYVFVPRAGMVSDKLSQEMFVKHGGWFMAANAVSGSLNFWMDPFNLICLYFFFEALFRGLAAVEGTRIVGTAPFYLISTLHGIWDRAEHKRYLGKLVEDEVQRGSESTTYDLRISSCRPKLIGIPT